MILKTSIEPFTLNFKSPAGTSRGIYLTHQVWYIHIFSDKDPGRIGIGECAPLPQLSCDDLPNYNEILRKACRNFELNDTINYEYLRPYPSILFGFETALKHFKKGSFALWDTPFSRGEQSILINGLIWMDTYEKMSKQIKEKIRMGFKCIKLKIGAINFEEEIALIESVREHFSIDTITLRVDANGAFSPDEALHKLKRLAKLGIHSIEQPIKAGQWNEMADLASNSPVPIALDEELIGCNTYEEKKRMLEVIRPPYIILKPSLHGGLKGCEEWIEIANDLCIGWWVTSALESNIGLNAIAQWCATLNNPVHHGLGTGMLYTNNIKVPLHTEGENLFFG